MADHASSVQEYPAVLEPLSRVPLRVTALFEGRSLSIATSFLHRASSGLFLITNSHVVTGRDPDTGKPLNGANSGIPDELTVDIPFMRIKEENRAVLWWQPGTLKLYTDPGREEARWLVHPIHGPKVDVVAIPFNFTAEHIAVVPANDPSLDLQSVVLLPSLNVYVLGFPLGLTGGASYPIWKRATIANEPEFSIDGLPKLYIDTATKKGMSGAPVFVNEAAGWLRQESDGSRNRMFWATPGRRLVGVYASRIHAGSEFEAQLGIVWKADTIAEIISGGRTGKSSFWPA